MMQERQIRNSIHLEYFLLPSKLDIAENNKIWGIVNDDEECEQHNDQGNEI